MVESNGNGSTKNYHFGRTKSYGHDKCTAKKTVKGYEDCWTKAKVCTDVDKGYVNSLTLIRRDGTEDKWSNCTGNTHELDTKGGCITTITGRTGDWADSMGFYYMEGWD